MPKARSAGETPAEPKPKRKPAARATKAVPAPAPAPAAEVVAAAPAKPARKAAAKATPAVTAAPVEAAPAAKPARKAAAKAAPVAVAAPVEAAAPAKPARKAAPKAAPAAPSAPVEAEAPAKPARKAAAKPDTAIKQAFAEGPDAEPKPKRAKKREKVSPDRLEEMVAAVRGSLEDDKAEDLVVLDVTGRASFADRLIIATGQVERQIQAMATHLQEALEKIGMKLRRDRIQASPDWVLIDCGDLIVHLFKPEAREIYALERMWGPGSPGAEG